MPSDQRRIRPYRPSGLYTRAEPPPEVQQAMESLRQELVADKGGTESITTAERLLIDLAVAAAVKHQHVSAYLASMPSLVDKRRRRVWRVVQDSTSLAAHLQGLLRDLGLERRTARGVHDSIDHGPGGSDDLATPPLGGGARR